MKNCFKALLCMLVLGHCIGCRTVVNSANADSIAKRTDLERFEGIWLDDSTVGSTYFLRADQIVRKDLRTGNLSVLVDRIKPLMGIRELKGTEQLELEEYIIAYVGLLKNVPAPFAETICQLERENSLLIISTYDFERKKEFFLSLKPLQIESHNKSGLEQPATPPSCP